MSQPGGDGKASQATAIPFIDLQAQRARIAAPIDAAIAKVLAHGRFIMGPEIDRLEDELVTWAGARHAITCASGTDALWLALRALDIGPGDAVFVPAMSFAASAEAVVLVGATPVFVDVDGVDFNMNPQSLAAAVEATRANDELTAKAVMPVDLFGQPADYDAIGEIAREEGLSVIADAAQSFGATLRNRPVGSFGDITATSFFPAKPLGCYGDGGAVFTNDDALAETIRSLRIHGQGANQYENIRIGINGRFDTLQAAILLEKLKIFADEIDRRQSVAGRYQQALADVAKVPVVHADRKSVWAQFTLVVEARDDLQAALRRDGIPTAIYYPKSLNQQLAYSGAPSAPGGTPTSALLAQQVISLPMHPYLEPEVQNRIIAGVRAGLGG